MGVSEKGKSDLATPSAIDEKDVHHAATEPQKEKRRSRYLNLRRLPSLQEVLDRRTRPPLDLFCFYIFLQRESSEDALDFWLDVQQHENLCKAYFKDLKRSGRSIDDDWPEFAAYARSNGSFMTPMLDLGSAEMMPARRSSELAPANGGGRYSGNADVESGSHHEPSLRGRQGESMSNMSFYSTVERQGQGRSSSRASMREWGAGTATGVQTDMGTMGTTGTTMSRAARRSAARAPTVFSRDRAIEKAALVESAERIYLRYLLPGAEREIYLPPALRLTNFPVSSEHTVSPLIPDLFHAQKLYIFRALEQDAFPRFLRAKAFGNLTPTSSVIRLLLGLVILWGAFVLVFSLIFLDYKPRLTRLWSILPFLVAFNLLLAAYYHLSPLLAVFFQSETTPFRLITVRETYVRRLLLLRALWIEGLAVLLTAIFVVIFTVVPGHRL